MHPKSTSITRLAPSPTGGLHLGNARTFLVNWAIARQKNWRIDFRIDDLDSPRIKPGADRQAIDDLQWLGIDWDSDPTYQSHNIPIYHQHLVEMAAAGAIYPCRCTRSQIATACLSAPHADAHELRYPGLCRPTELTPIDFEKVSAEGVAWRFRVTDQSTDFMDQIAGPQSWNVYQHVGDFLVTNKRGIASYQLAVVVDDALAGVDQVIRGDDLLSSTARQILLQSRMRLSPCQYWHLPIVVGPDGQRLAKRHGGWTIQHYRSAGVSAAKIRGLIARWSGIEWKEEISKQDFVRSFDLKRFPRQRVVFTESAHKRLSQPAE